MANCEKHGLCEASHDGKEDLKEGFTKNPVQKNLEDVDEGCKGNENLEGCRGKESEGKVTVQGERMDNLEKVSQQRCQLHRIRSELQTVEAKFDILYAEKSLWLDRKDVFYQIGRELNLWWDKLVALGLKTKEAGDLVTCEMCLLLLSRLNFVGELLQEVLQVYGHRTSGFLFSTDTFKEPVG